MRGGGALPSWPLPALRSKSCGRKAGFLPDVSRMHSKGRTADAEKLRNKKVSATVQASSVGMTGTTIASGQLTGDRYDRRPLRRASARS